MKKKLIYLISLVAILAVSACSAASSSSQSASETQTATSGSSELPMLSKLVVGTYKLIGSSTPITQDQAKKLVILWKAYKELQTRDTKAQQEVTDLLSQINSNFTAEQVSTITAMNLSVRDVMTMAQELGVNTAQGTTRTGSSSSSSSTSGSSSSRSSGAAGGGFPGGGIPPDAGGGGFAFGGGTSGSGTSSTPSASLRATMQARRSSSSAFTNNIALLLIEPLIVKLEAIANPA
jgi:hypothetical protein